jgi:hypothetical protein
MSMIFKARYSILSSYDSAKIVDLWFSQNPCYLKSILLTKTVLKPSIIPFALPQYNVLPNANINFTWRCLPIPECHISVWVLKKFYKIGPSNRCFAWGPSFWDYLRPLCPPVSNTVIPNTASFGKLGHFINPLKKFNCLSNTYSNQSFVLLRETFLLALVLDWCHHSQQNDTYYYIETQKSAYI